MREKLAALALLLCTEVPMTAQGSLRYTVELEDLRERAQRLELLAPGWRLLALERGTGLDPDVLAIGLDCPWAAIGPLAPRGLLRALADPLGYSPGSGVFSEPAGFRLESALQATSRRGLWLEPLPGRLGLFLVRKPQAQQEAWGAGLWGSGAPGLVQAGGALTLHWPELGLRAGRGAARYGGGPPPPVRMEAQVLALLSHPTADSRISPSESGARASSSPEWLQDRPPFPGGGLAHLGGTLQLETRGGSLSCCLLTAASGGQRVPAGLLGLWRLAAQGGRWNAQALLGACSPDYRLPQGEPYAGAWAAGLRLEARPRPALRLAAGWQRRVDRPPAEPEGHLPGTEKGELNARLTVPLRAGGRLELRAAADARVKYAADGTAEPSAAAALGLELRGKAGAIDLELQGDWKEDGPELRGLLSGEREGVRIEVGARGQPAAGRAATGSCWRAAIAGLRPFGRLELAGTGFRFWFSAEGGDAGGEISLGWSAAQPLSKSPTVRTSRRRR